MYLQAVAEFDRAQNWATHTIPAASKCYGAVAFTNNSTEIQRRAPELASSCPGKFYKEITKILVSDTAGGNSWL
jgi:hypothetical protein